MAGKVTTGLAESNGSLPLGGWLNVTCGLTACTPGSAAGPTLGIEYGKAFTFTFIPVNSFHAVTLQLVSFQLLWLKRIWQHMTETLQNSTGCICNITDIMKWLLHPQFCTVKCRDSCTYRQRTAHQGIPWRDVAEPTCAQHRLHTTVVSHVAVSAQYLWRRASCQVATHTSTFFRNIVNINCKKTCFSFLTELRICFFLSSCIQQETCNYV